MKIDLYEASVPTRPRDLRPGDQVAVSNAIAHTVKSVEATPSGATLVFTTPKGTQYRVHRSSSVHVVKR